MQKVYIFTSLFFLTFAGCYINGMITTEEDIVKSITRSRIEFYHSVIEHNSPLNNIKQTITKEFGSGNQSFTFYEQISMDVDAFSLEDTVYIIAGNRVFPFLVENQESRNKSVTSENTETIMQADSSEVTVVTGYSTSNYKILNIKYQVPEEIMYSLAKSYYLQFRYYSGPRMITTSLSSYEMDKLRYFIRME